MEFTNYSVIEKIHEGHRYAFYRALRKNDQKKVILKTAVEEFPSPKTIASLRHEFETNKRFDSPFILKTYTLEKEGKTPFLVLEDIDGIPLDQLLTDHSCSLADKIWISIQISKGLEEIHKKKVVHKDIKPSNIIVNWAKQEIKISDFNISTFPEQQERSVQVDDLEGTLLYIAPEQTGRMNRAVDHRADLYSFGITLYEMLVGKTPFDGLNNLELVHAHIAKKAPPLQEIDSTIPTVLSAIVLKLLSKNPEERYQSCYGIEKDLTTCLEMLQKDGEIGEILLAQEDIPDTLLMPQKLYGRDKEISFLVESLEEVARGNVKLVLVSGYSGIGKSALVHEIYKPLAEKGGHFISGKFDQFKNDLPYSAIIQSFQELIRHILSSNPEKIEQIKERLMEALGLNGQLIIDVIPELQMIIGEQPPAVEIDPKSAEKRFNSLFQNFACAFLSKEMPLAFFFDDLQWADLSSLKFILDIMTSPNSKYLLLLGAYRDNEVDSTHPLRTTLNQIENALGPITNLELKNLDFSHVNELVADMLFAEQSRCEELAKAIMQKTGGNPFFLIALMKSAYNEQAVFFNYELKIWEWNLDALHKLNASDNVVDLLISRLNRYPIEEQNVLQIAACLGNQFKLNELALVIQTSQAAIAKNLKDFIYSGFLIALDKIEYFLYSENEEVPALNESTITLKFLHDRGHQSAYALVQDKEAIHLGIARAFLNDIEKRGLGNSYLEERAFDIAYQFNKAFSIVNDPSERIRVAQINLMAADKACLFNAFAPALIYATNGVKILPENCWENFRELTFNLHYNLAKVYYCTNQYTKAHEVCDLIIQHKLPTAMDTAAYMLKFQMDGLQENLNLSEIVKYIDAKIFPLPKQLTQVHLSYEWLKFHWLIYKLQRKKGSVVSLAHAEEVTDSDLKVQFKILFFLLTCVMMMDARWFCYIVLKSINAILKSGKVTVVFAPLYAQIALVLVMCQKDLSLVRQFRELTFATIERFQSREYYTRALFMLTVYCGHAIRDFKVLQQEMDEVAQHALKIGDIILASHCKLNYSMFSHYGGFPLTMVLQRAQEGFNFYSVKSGTAKNSGAVACQAFQQQILALVGKTKSLTSLSDENVDEEELRRLALGSVIQFTACAFLLNKIELCYLGGKYLEATKEYAIIENNQHLLELVTCIPLFHRMRIFYILALEADWVNRDKQERKQAITAIKQALKYFKILQASIPANYAAYYLMMLGEYARIRGKTTEAIQSFTQAIEVAKGDESPQQEAMANELLAKLYLLQGNKKVAALYFREASYIYSTWGASAKVKQLEELYPDLLQTYLSEKQQQKTTNTKTITPTSSGSSSNLDFEAVISMSQTISQEILLDKLVEKLLDILSASAGAEKAALLLQQQGSWIVCAEKVAGKATNSLFLKNVTFENYPDLPIPMIRYVIRTGQALVLDDACCESRFSQDPYIAQHQVKSVICAPLIYKGNFNAILYLENNLSSKAFTPARLEVVKLLSSQVVTSLENAFLYQNQAELVRQRTHELQEALDKLKLTSTKLVEQEKMASLGILTAGIAHEINNPNNFIYSGFAPLQLNIDDLVSLINAYTTCAQDEHPIQKLKEAEQLKADLDIEFSIQEIQHLLKTMKEGSDRITKTVDTLRMYSRLDEADFKPTNLNENIDSVITLYHPRLKDGVTIVTQYGKLPLIQCMTAKLNQALEALISNANDFTTGSGEITIKTEQKDNRVLISVRDQGIGMSEEVKQHIFEPFYTTKDVGLGQGLGLSIVYNIVEEHHGTIEVLTEPGKGSEFRLTLPISF